MNLLYKITLLFSLINYTIYAAEVQFQNTTPYATEVYGDIKLIGNTILRVDTNSNRTTDEGYFPSDDQKVMDWEFQMVKFNMYGLTAGLMLVPYHQYEDGLKFA